MRYKANRRTVTEERFDVERACDLCKRDVDHAATCYSDESSVEIGAKLGKYYPGADCRTYYAIDVCPECFLSKVKPAIEALGATFREWGAEGNEPILEEPPK